MVCCPPVQEVVEKEEDDYYSYDEGEEEEVSRDVLKALTHKFTKKKASSSTLYTRTVHKARPISFVHLPSKKSQKRQSFPPIPRLRSPTTTTLPPPTSLLGSASATPGPPAQPSPTAPPLTSRAIGSRPPADTTKEQGCTGSAARTGATTARRRWRVPGWSGSRGGRED